jgi:hypothetical protein
MYSTLTARRQMLRIASPALCTGAGTAAVQAGRRFNTGSGTASNGTNTTATPDAAKEREAELQREQEARQRLFSQGMPNPWKNQNVAGAANQPFGNSPPSIKAAWDQAYAEASKKFFGTDKPPEHLGQWGQAWRDHSAANKGSSGSSNPTTSTTVGDTATASTSNTGSATTAASGGGNGTSTPFGGAAPFPGFPGAPGGARQPPRVGRLLAGLIIVYCSFWMMRRNGFFGNFNHVHIPYWVLGYEDTAKWLLFLFNLDEKRREEIQRNYEAAKTTYPALNFFDYVDSVQPDWCSSPNYSKQQVTAALTSLMREESSWIAIGRIRSGLEASSGFFSYFGGSDGTTMTPLQKRIESLMRSLPQQHQMLAGGMKPMMFARTVPEGQSGGSGPWSPVGLQNSAFIPTSQLGNFQVTPGPQFGYGGGPQFGGGGWQQGGGGVPPQYGGYGGQYQQHQQQYQQQWPQQQWGQQQYQPVTQGHGTVPFASQQQPQQEQGRHQQADRRANGNSTDHVADSSPSTAEVPAFDASNSLASALEPSDKSQA